MEDQDFNDRVAELAEVTGTSLAGWMVHIDGRPGGALAWVYQCEPGAGWVVFSRRVVGGAPAVRDMIVLHELTHVRQINSGRLRYVRAPAWMRLAFGRDRVTEFEGRRYPFEVAARTGAVGPRRLLQYYRKPWEREALFFSAESDAIGATLEERLGPPGLLGMYRRLKLELTGPRRVMGSQHDGI